MIRKGLFAVFAIVAVLSAAIVSNAQKFDVGTKLDGFTLSDLGGASRTLDSVKGTNGTLLVFLSAQCPVVKGYNARINQIADDYKAKGIAFVGINSNATESLDWVKSNATEVGYKFPVLIDKNNVIADILGASYTPEVYFFDAKNVLVYHGAIDNDRSGKAITDQYLRTAFDEALAGKSIGRAKTMAFGCSIKRKGE